MGVDVGVVSQAVPQSEVDVAATREDVGVVVQSSEETPVKGGHKGDVEVKEQVLPQSLSTLEGIKLGYPPVDVSKREVVGLEEQVAPQSEDVATGGEDVGVVVQLVSPVSFAPEVVPVKYEYVDESEEEGVGVKEQVLPQLSSGLERVELVCEGGDVEVA